MALPEPTVVYRSRVFQDAESLADFLREAGINARLASPRRIGHLGEGPVFDVLHDVCAVDCSADDVQTLISRWRLEYGSTRGSDVLFCHHCGETIEIEWKTCPSCGKSLEPDSSESIENG